MSTIHNVGPSQFASSDAATQSGGDGANGHRDQPQQYYQSEYPGYHPYQQRDLSQQEHQVSGYQLSAEQFYSQSQQNGSSGSNLLPPIPGMSQDAPSFQLSAASSVSPVPNAGEFSYGSHAMVSPATPTAGNPYGGDAYTLSSSTTPMTVSSNQQQFPPLPPQNTKQLPQHLRLVNTPLYHSYSYQPIGQAQGNQQHQQQPPPPSIMLGGNPITPTASSYQTNALSSAVAPSSAGPGSTQPKQRAPRNKSKFKRFRNAFIYFVNDQRNKVDDETKKLKNREFLQLMSARWKKMPEDERRPYIDMAEEDKKRFEDDVKKYGKYESRQRRYTKGKPHGKSAVGQAHGAVPYTVPHPAGTNHLNAADAASDFAYHSGINSANDGSGNMPISSLYASLSPVTPSAAMAAAANWPANMRYVDLARNGGGNFQHQQQQNNNMLSPANTMLQRNSNSSIESANDIRNIQAALNTADYGQWSRANAHQQGYGGIPSTVSGLTAVSMTQGAGGGDGGSGPYFSNAYQQLSQHQQSISPGGSLMQLPTGVPISHSLTEPMLFYGTGDGSNPYLSPGATSTTNNGV